MNHFYEDVSNLNAPYSTIAHPVQGVGGGLGSCGCEDRPCSEMVWGAYSDCTKSLQSESLNVSLKEEGLALLSADGELGPKTCGALDYFGESGWAPDCAAHESEWIEPVKAGSTRPRAATTDVDQSDLVGVGRPSSVPGWVYGVAIGVIAIGASIYLKKKR